MVPKKAEKARLRPHLSPEKPRRPFYDRNFRKVDGKRETRLLLAPWGCPPASARRIGSCASLARSSRHRLISAARDARGCVADLCEDRARSCSIVRPSAAAGACGSRSAYHVRPVCGCLARAIRVFRPSTRCATPAGPVTCAYSTFCMRVGCSFIVPVRMLRGI